MVHLARHWHPHREGDTMTPDDILLLLGEARENIAQAHVTLRRLAHHDPRVARMELPRLRRMAKRQRSLERNVQIQRLPELGFAFLPVIIAGAGLLGLGGWVFKHHEETSLERYKLETMENCITQNMDAGMSREEANRICSELIRGKDLSDVFSELGKTILIAGAAVVGVYLVIKWK